MSNKKLLAKQKELIKLQDGRKKLIDLFLKNDALIEGSYIELLQKCGRPTCVCVKKPTHLVSRISKWTGGKLKHKIVKIKDRSHIRKLAAVYKQHKNAMAKLVKDAKKERELMNVIIKLRNQHYE